MSQRTNIKKIWKYVANLHDEKEHVIHIINLKQELNHGLVQKKCIESIDLMKRFA